MTEPAATSGRHVVLVLAAGALFGTAGTAAAFGPDAAPYVDYPAGHVEAFPDTFKMAFRAIYSRIAGGMQGDWFFASARDGHEEVAVCEAILKSHGSKAWVGVGG